MRRLLFTVTAFLFLTGGLLAQRVLTGTVSDDKGNALPNASVTIKGTRSGTVTNSDGKFSLNADNNARTLVVSSVGFNEQEVTIGSQTNFTFTLVTSTNSLDEVVVVGYSTISKRALTGAVGKVNGEAIADKPVTSFDQALTGKAAGVQINTSSGLIGDNVNIRIRGASSISSGSEPLIVMDGVPLVQGDRGQLYNPANVLAEINPNDIESVEILKDASSAAIYGSRAAGGVILITTKKGRVGQNNVTYDGYAGFTESSRKMVVLNADQYTGIINKLRSNAGLSNVANYGDIDGNGQPDIVSTDWQEEVQRKGFVQSHQVAASGGTARSTYYTSLSYNDFENYINSNRQTRGAVRLNMTTKVKDWLQIGINSQYSRTKSYGLGSGVGGALSGIPFGPLTMFPNIPVRDANGEFYIGNGGNTIAGNVPNPVAVNELNFDNRDARRFIGSAFGEIQFIKGLKLKSQINLDYQSAFNDQFWNPVVGDGQGSNAVAQTVQSEFDVWTWFNTLNYTKTFGNHDINALIGTEWTRNRSMYAYNYGVDIFDPDLTIVSPDNYAVVGAANDIDVDDGLASYFATVNYGFKNKYFATANFRADYSSKFGSDHKVAPFPSFSLGWRMSQENFMSNVAFVKELKIRASHGTIGNNSFGYYPSLALYAASQYADFGASTLSSPGNSALKWERQVQTDFGLDAIIFKNTSINLDFYRKASKDLILNNPVLATLGFPGNTVTENIGEFKTDGIELTVGTPILTRRNFTWDVNFNISYNKNMVNSTNSNNDDVTSTYNLVRPGYAIGTFYLIRWGGVNPANGLPVFLDVNGVEKQYDHSKPTASRWTTLKDNQVTTGITAADRVILKGKTPYPKFFGGLSQTLKYRELDMMIDLQYAFDYYIYNNTLQNLMVYTNNRNKSEYIQRAWSTAGQETDVPRLYYGDNQQSQNSTRWLEKGDFLRIRNIQLGYTLPQSVISKLSISKVRFFVQVQNAYTFTKYKGMDPESNANGNVNIGLGVDSFRPYLPRTYTAGLNVIL